MHLHLHQLRSVRRSVPRSVLQSLMTSLVLTRLDHGNATLAGIPLYLLKRLPSVMNSAAQLVFSSWRYEHITPLLCQLHWLKAAERIDYKLALLVYKCRQGLRSTAVPRRQTLPASRHRSSMLSAFHLGIVTDCPPYAAVNRR